jgi:hypothetical protein
MKALIRALAIAAVSHVGGLCPCWSIAGRKRVLRRYLHVFGLHEYRFLPCSIIICNALGSLYADAAFLLSCINTIQYPHLAGSVSTGVDCAP